MKIQLKGITGGKDRRGLLGLSYRFLFTESSEAEALLAALPVTVGVPEVSRTIAEWDVNNSGFIIQANFEGLIDEPGEDQDQYIIRPEWREEPIEAFPDRAALETKYGAYEEEGRIKFPQYLERSSNLGGSGATEDEANPLFGTTTYPVMRITASHSYVRFRVPSSVYTNVGKVVKRLPSGFQDPPKRTWIVDVPQVRRRGNCWEIVETWKEVDRLKHLEALYLLLGKLGNK